MRIALTVVIMNAAAMSVLASAPASQPVSKDPSPALLDVKVEQVEVNGVPGIRVTDSTGRVLVEPNGQPIVGSTKCHADWDMDVVPGGFDIRVTLQNKTQQSQPRPDVMLRGIRIAERFQYLDARDLGRVRSETRKPGQPIFWAGWDYPDDLYAPVAMLANEQFAVGVSLIYDVMTARHSVIMSMHTEGGKFAGTSGIGANLNVRAPAWAQPVGRLALEPETTAHYRLTLRFARPENWLDTLSPYREHFLRQWGKVKYKADRRPVYGETMALDGYRDAEKNPRGYPPHARYDQVGFKPIVDEYEQKAVSAGYRRVMIWASAGLYMRGPNYPCEFMTEWPAKLVETRGELDRLTRAGVTVGHWWGRAGQVSGGWDTGRMWVRDMGVAADVQAGLNELKLARDRGANEVGLDASGAMPLWQRIEWVRLIQKEFPTMRFITEAADCDIMHTLAPTYMTFERQGDQPVLADYLNPGHESWIQLRWQLVNQKNVDTITGWGCVPVTMSRAIRHDASAFSAGSRGAPDR